MKTGIELVNECCEKHGIDPVDLVNYYEHRLHATRDNLPLLFISEGVQLIAEERREQIEKHGYTIELDAKNYLTDIPLIIAAMYCLDPQHKNAPFGWDRDGVYAQKLRQKPRVERHAIAGAFIAAAIDHFQNANQLNK